MKARFCVFALAAAVAACSSAPPSPAGWRPVPGASGQWSTGSGSSAQTYGLSRRPFSGTLQDLASQEAVNVVLRLRGARFVTSTPLASCPGEAAVATFKLPGGGMLEDGFAVQNTQAVIVQYARGSGHAQDPAVAVAMEKALCVTPL